MYPYADEQLGAWPSPPAQNAGGDGPFCLGNWLNEKMGRHLTDPPRELPDERYLGFAKGIEQDEGWYPFIAVLRETGRSIGTCSACPTGDFRVLGCRIHEDYWRRGFAIEILRALLDFGTENGARVFTADMAKENAAPNALLQKPGFIAASEDSFRKRGSDIVYPSFTYRVELLIFFSPARHTETLAVSNQLGGGNMTESENEKNLIEAAVSGDQKALETLLCGVQDMVFNLALRMLGLVPDAEDATQEILIKVMTHLSSFRQESRLSTWVFRIAANHLRDYRKGMFAQRPLSFEAYGADIVSGREKDVPDLTAGVDRSLLERELKLSCTNVMLQCLDAESRCIYILGTMFRLDSRIAADILELTPEAYRQRLSRARRKVADFLGEYCGLSGTGSCSCKRRVNYAIASHRIDPARLDYHTMKECGYNEIVSFTDAMEQLDGLSQIFAGFPAYRSPEELTAWIRGLLASDSFAAVRDGQAVQV